MKRSSVCTSLLLGAILIGCASSSIPDAELAAIPENALEIRVTGDMVPEEYFGEIRQELLRQAFELPMQSNQRMFLVTDYKPIGGQLQMSIHLTVTADVNGQAPIAVFRGFYRRPGEGEHAAQWTSSPSDRARAFRAMFRVASAIPQVGREYGVAM